MATQNPLLETVLTHLSGINVSIVELTHLTTTLTSVQAEGIAKLRRISNWTIVIATLSLILALGGAVSIYLMYQTERELSHQSKEIISLQERTSTDVLCPLYNLFLSSYNPNSLNAKENPERYEQSFKVIEDGAKTLGCKAIVKGNLVPKPAP